MIYIPLPSPIPKTSLCGMEKVKCEENVQLGADAK
jgi:hypothetical protein